ncbi:hypothetical protein [Asticcacaulis sp.]|uniref:hypothetical protein n=1 Tax=Asticcacaulis sp. TaxID=1872648 RepID=UPI0031D86D62
MQITPEAKAEISAAVAQGRDGVYDRISYATLVGIMEPELPNYWHTVIFLSRTVDGPPGKIELSEEQKTGQRERLDEAWAKLQAYAAGE